ncbi:dipeptidase [Candidatus Sumerlaeota bacterium]|nr:dipeptidase [Candidatus Sumerlaeota bacterium]
MDEVLARIDSERDRSISDLKDLLRIPSVSSRPDHSADMARAAEWLRARLEAMGLETRICETPGHPIVYAEWLSAPGKPTVLIYGHFDVQPVEPLDEWSSDPFEPVEEGGNLIARGANDDKGQMFTHVRAVEAWLSETGSLPVNVKFLIEGEEEIGSPNLPAWLRENREMVKADVVAISDTSQFGPGYPSVCTGLRGIATFEMRVKTGQSDLHSGTFGGAVPNAIQVMTDILASFHTPEGAVAIEGFYSDVVEPTEEERASWARLPRSDEQFMREAGTRSLWGEPGRTSIERTWSRPTLEIVGVTAGHQGPGHKGIVPATAVARFSTRLVPEMDPERVVRLVQSHVAKRTPPGAEVSAVCGHGARGTLIPADSKWVQAAKRALAVGFGKEPVFIREGGSIPIVNLFQGELGMPCLLLGYGLPDDRIHGPNEKFSMADFQSGTRTNAALLAELAAL